MNTRTHTPERRSPMNAVRPTLLAAALLAAFPAFAQTNQQLLDELRKLNEKPATPAPGPASGA
jgi:hypothetical protein